MKKTLKELKQLKGVWEVLSRRLVEAGHDTLAKVVAAGEDGLKKVQGINQRMVSGILEQAGQLAGEGQPSKAQKVEELKRQAASLREKVPCFSKTQRTASSVEIEIKTQN